MFSSSQKLVYCIVDFNVIVNHSKKNSSTVSNHCRMASFSNHVKRCGLIDMGYNGPAFTWCNKRFTSMPTDEHLDRCFANAEWCNEFPNTVVLQPSNYVQWSCTNFNDIHTDDNKNQKNLNCWLFEDDYHDAARNNWITINDKPYHVRTILLAGTLKKWTKSKRPLKQQLDTIHKDRDLVQSVHTHL